MENCVYNIPLNFVFKFKETGCINVREDEKRLCKLRIKLNQTANGVRSFPKSH